MIFSRLGVGGASLRRWVWWVTQVSPFRSIPFSFWWVLVTTTTTGYGDFFPTTVMGKTVGVCAMITGILMLALPITVIGANFAHEYEKDRKLKEQFKAEMTLRKARERERRAAGEDARGGGGAAGGGKPKQPSLGDAIKARLFKKSKPHPASDPHSVYAALGDANGNGGDTGSTSPNGHAANGHAANGHAANGHAANGHAANGHAENGHAANKRVFAPANASSSWTRKDTVIGLTMRDKTQYATPSKAPPKRCDPVKGLPSDVVETFHDLKCEDVVETFHDIKYEDVVETKHAVEYEC